MFKEFVLISFIKPDVRKTLNIINLWHVDNITIVILLYCLDESKDDIWFLGAPIPTNVEVLDKGPNSLSVRWESQVSNRIPLQRYEVQYGNRSRSFRPSSFSSSFTYTFTLSHLRSNTRYPIRIRLLDSSSSMFGSYSQIVDGVTSKNICSKLDMSNRLLYRNLMGCRDVINYVTILGALLILLRRF